jgi:hypothetical protein
MKRDDHMFRWICPSDDYDIHVGLIKFDREKHSVVALMKYIDRQSYQDCAVANVHKLEKSYFGVRSVVPISESLRKEGFTVFKITILAKWQADVKGTFHNLYVCFRNLLEAKASNEFGTCWDSSTSLLPLWQSQDLR